ncbi:membrane protein-like protein [Thermoanaerobacter mathranii subsp. mathranii str. A3]|uniref:Riboflavin transporter n=2 Tax=Thermoanaerobacter TaxID=1754 RepID=A0ABT9M5B9_9THEO|nr:MULTISPECIES: ECF transporter S component [Thermoanaerobacter]ADH60350.1 membrane protein-like protein [Thermoanaerobacter mathranii subsp. mathranii str. A3]MBT1278274.1 ECF transporter S component [Thermoanaerobacter sp. CM-CNRG TB177]MDK2814433.1 riboflavin transporter [Thermoanaerobacter sp.]MDP9751324.1 riboflavin transporter FmnP [Thermoanaerobacter pentosaceus]
MEKTKTQTIVKVGFLSATAFILMYLEFQVPLFPGFLKLDFSDVPALVASFAIGPLYGVMVELIKNILHATVTQSGAIGEIANFTVGSIFVYAAGVIYQFNKTRKTALISMAIATVVMAVTASLLNYYVFLPLYQRVMGWPMDAIINMGKAANKNIVDVKTLISYGIFPFNILKGIVVSVITFLVYKKLSPFFKH